MTKNLFIALTYLVMLAPASASEVTQWHSGFTNQRQETGATQDSRPMSPGELREKIDNVVATARQRFGTQTGGRPVCISIDNANLGDSALSNEKLSRSLFYVAHKGGILGIVKSREDLPWGIIQPWSDEKEAYESIRDQTLVFQLCIGLSKAGQLITRSLTKNQQTVIRVDIDDPSVFLDLLMSYVHEVQTGHNFVTDANGPAFVVQNEKVDSYQKYSPDKIELILGVLRSRDSYKKEEIVLDGLSQILKKAKKDTDQKAEVGVNKKELDEYRTWWKGQFKYFKTSEGRNAIYNSTVNYVTGITVQDGTFNQREMEDLYKMMSTDLSKFMKNEYRLKYNDKSKDPLASYVTPGVGPRSGCGGC